MNRKAVCAAVVTALSLAGVVNAPAHAVETFVCEDGSTVSAEASQLEALKRTNACVAQHFGLAPETGPAASALSVPPPPRRPATAVTAAPVQTPRATTPVAATAVVSKPMTTGSIKSSARHLEPGTFRRVRILNPSPGGADYFLHTR